MKGKEGQWLDIAKKLAILTGLTMPYVLAHPIMEYRAHHDMIHLILILPAIWASLKLPLAGSIIYGGVTGYLVWFIESTNMEPNTMDDAEFAVFIGLFILSINVGMGLLVRRLRLQARQLREANKALEDMANKDPLTGLGNSRYFWSFLEGLHEPETDTPYAVILFDIDYFKGFNDTFGHLAGDSLLISVGKVAKEAVRQGDLACRYGGDEMAIILPGAGVPEAQMVGQRILEKIREITCQIPEGLASVTASMGIAAYPLHGADYRTVVAAADKALYAAKHAGRDCLALPEQGPCCFDAGCKKK